MTPVEQYKLREQLVETILSILGVMDRTSGNRPGQIATLELVIAAYITADRKRVALEARIDELEYTFVSYDNALASELVENPEWEYGQVAERIAELKAQQEEV